MVLLIIIVVVLFWFILNKINGNFLTRQFTYQNVIVFGKKRTGKDLIFQYVINKINKPHYANQSYGKKTIVESISSLSVAPNTFEDCIDNKFIVVKPLLKAGYNFYVSDGGIFLPSQYNTILNKKYPSFPIYYALSGQIRHMNIHVNVQNILRLWDKIREQADYYVRAVKTVNLPFYLAVKVICYEEYEDAINNLKTLKVGFFGNKFEKALKRVENSARGDIRSFWIFVRKKSIKYDTHYFEKVFYGKYAELTVKRRRFVRKKISK